MTQNNHLALARQKTEKTTGGDVNYYLVDILRCRLNGTCVAEVEDIIEQLDMRFSEGNVFKAMVRSAKLRQDLGKPGSSKIYEAEKAVYYFDRTVARTERRARHLHGAIEASFELDMVITISEPKRLEPYSFHVDDFLYALEPTMAEEDTLRAIFKVCMVRQQFANPLAEERIAIEGAKAARQVLAENQS